MNTETPTRAWLISRLFLLTLTLFLAGCFPGGETPDTNELRGTIMLWHSLPEERARALATVIARFESLHPDTTVYMRQLPSEEALFNEYTTAVQSGLGGDLILASSATVSELAANGVIRPLGARLDSQSTSQYLASALTTLGYNGTLYGLPFDVNTLVLYYDTDRVPAPATTLDQLIADARDGKTVLMSSSFREALWGFRAYGASLIDPQTSHLTFNQGGFVNWLTWLQQARETPGVVFDPDQGTLLQAFLDGRGAYYVGRASDLPAISAAMGEKIGVTALPTGPNGSAGPLLSTTGFMVNAMSSEAQANLALALAQFLTNPEQQAVMMRESLLVPANISTRVSPGLFPAVAAIQAQARTAIALPNDQESVAALTTIASAFNAVVEGLTRPTDAAQALNNQLAGVVAGATQSHAATNCPAAGTVEIMTYDVGVTQRILDVLVQGYRLLCPEVTVKVTLLPPTSSIRLASATDRFEFDADILFDLYGDVPLLIQNGRAADLTDLVPNDVVQSLRVQTLAGLRNSGRIFGLPITIDVPALYYNRGLVADPAVTLDDLRSQALSGTPVAMDSTFDRAFWGIGAFGGRLTDEQNRFALDPVAVGDWLAWLIASRERSNIALEPNIDVQSDAFTAGNSAYYVGGIAEATGLRAALDSDRLAAIVFPEGPRGSGRPLMRVGSMVVNSELDEQQLARAASFVTYAAGIDAQQRLLETGLVAPTNAGVNLTGRNTANVFLSQVQNAQIYNSQVLPPAVANMLRSLFNQVLNQNAPAAEAIAQTYRDLSDYRQQNPGFAFAPSLDEQLASLNAAPLEGTAVPTATVPAGGAVDATVTPPAAEAGP